MSSFMPDNILLDIEKLETMLTNSSSSCSGESSLYNFQTSPNSRSVTTTARFTGSSKIYLRNLNKLLADIEQKQKILSHGGGSILKRLRPVNSSSSSSRSLTFTSLFTRPSVKCISNNRLEPKTMSFAQLITQTSSFPSAYSNHQSEYGCAKLNEKMWVVHCREQLIKAVNDELKQTLQEESNLDWNHISSYHLSNKWSAGVCENAWKQVCNPRINQSKWSNKEDRRLLSIVEREPLSADRWTSIAKELGTDRSAYLCAKRYMQITNDKHSKRPLEINERNQIISNMKDDKQGYYRKYNKLAYELGDRTREFIYNQWLHIDPSCKRGRWSDVEQAQLLTHIHQQTHKITNWPLVSAPVHTRSSRQCRERVLDTIKNGNRTTKEKHRLFTADEDRLLLEQYALHGAKWSIIAKEFSARTDNSLLVRYRMLIKAKTQWDWFCQTNSRMKSFLLFLYNRQMNNNDTYFINKNSTDILSLCNNANEIQHDLEQFGFYRRGLPFPITDEEFQWFNQKPELIENIAQIALEEFTQQRLCFRKFKAEIKPWFTSSLFTSIPNDIIRQMLCRTIPSRRKRKSISSSASTIKRSKTDGIDQLDNTGDIDCKQEPRVPQLPSILTTTSRHVLRPVPNQFFTSQSTTKLSMTSSSTHFCPYLILIRQNS
ncbi:unnamed protein product [Rotaria magnacalcarata]|uniref:Uncharacterized protein n=2 Tax=Rotaria magnacalcarata TaxID=392030 RepID=A0A816DBB2_9BILA|nr:unnamed protein product [Rotaria magnacalcarata]CAF1634067.1 unnamed protein product [Rotaria magnacalcarata]CAF2078696.1 unnamed protein product [Rotaria magnacalcarata]CAF2116427.1 unnamed protein product [Rotaria magnacalcarata]CAF3841608.1 unnamed protein product [Rotaria magnacalcarata]